MNEHLQDLMTWSSMCEITQERNLTRFFAGVHKEISFRGHTQTAQTGVESRRGNGRWRHQNWLDPASLPAKTKVRRYFWVFAEGHILSSHRTTLAGEKPYTFDVSRAGRNKVISAREL